MKAPPASPPASVTCSSGAGLRLTHPASTSPPADASSARRERPHRPSSRRSASRSSALEAALEQARWRCAPLVVVNVASGEAPVDPKIAPESDVAALVERGTSAGVEQPVDDDVAGAILAAASARGGSVVVVNTRRRSPVGKLLLGIVSQRVVLEADRPVLCVKAPA
jgi:nucleotide-binding universal stress UspA family protein